MSTSRYCESAPRLSGGGEHRRRRHGHRRSPRLRPPPLSRHRLPHVHVAHLEPATVADDAAMIASVLTHAEPRVSVLLSELRAQDVRCPPVAQLEKLQQYPPEQSSGLSSSRSSITSSPNASVCCRTRWPTRHTCPSTLLCALDRLFDKASLFVIRGPSYRGRELDTYSVEAAPGGEGGGSSPRRCRKAKGRP